MTTCRECSFFFTVPENADDYEPGKGDCVTEKEDAKGKYWRSKPTMIEAASCQLFRNSNKSLN